MITLSGSASPEGVLKSLKHLVSELINVQNGDDAPSAWRARYIYWTNEAVRLLATQLRHGHLEQLVTSRRYWALLGVNTLGVDTDADRILRSVIRTEVRERIAEFESVIADMEKELDQWSGLDAPAVAVLDTNVLHQHHSDLAGFPWNEKLGVRPDRDILLVVPIAVIDELDGQKLSAQKAADGKTPLRTSARASLRTLDRLLQVDSTVRLTERSVVDERSAVHIRLLTTDLDHVALDDTDSEIIDRALTLQPFARDVRLVTYDYAMAFRARHAGLNEIRLSHDD